MKRSLIYLALALGLIICSMACSNKARIIPESKLSEIYAEMFIADEWLREHPAAHKTADTSLFYEPIFNKFGYTTADYQATVDRYIYKPEDFAKVFQKTADILEKLEAKDRAMQEIIDGINEANRSIRGYLKKDFTDSLIWADSSILWHKIDTLACLDSLFAADSIVLDSLALDSLARLDSLAAMDSLAGIVNELEEVAVEEEEKPLPEKNPENIIKKTDDKGGNSVRPNQIKKVGVVSGDKLVADPR